MITPKTLLGFLFFQRESILCIASSSSARWLGLVFVLSAGIAREYDGEYFLGEPWHLGLPLAASVIGCIAISILVEILARIRMEHEASLLTQFGCLLNVYWMMAPMAMLYAIPFERFMDPGNATRANLVLLGIISVWRVTLMIRCVSVLYGASLIAATMPVMVFCLGMVYAALSFIPSPVFMLMGGIRLTESEDIILGTKLILIAGGVFTAPIWIIGYIACCLARSPWKWQLRESERQNQPVSMASWLIAFLSFVFLTPFLPFTQHEQWLRWRAEQHIFAGAFGDLSKLTHECTAKDLPPHWDPPPRIGYGDTKPELLSTTLSIHASHPADWFWKLYMDKFERLGYDFRNFINVRNLDDSELSSFIAVFDELSISSRLAQSIHDSIDTTFEVMSISDERRELLKAIQSLCKRRSDER